MSVFHAHVGIVHRDIKPASFRIRGDGRLRLLDLGVALSGCEPSEQCSRNAGTPTYMNPELWADAPPDPQSDLDALGAHPISVADGNLPYGEIEHYQNSGFSPRPETAVAFARRRAYFPGPLRAQSSGSRQVAAFRDRRINDAAAATRYFTPVAPTTRISTRRARPHSAVEDRRYGVADGERAAALLVVVPAALSAVSSKTVFLRVAFIDAHATDSVAGSVRSVHQPNDRLWFPRRLRVFSLHRLDTPKHDRSASQIFARARRWQRFAPKSRAFWCAARRAFKKSQPLSPPRFLKLLSFFSNESTAKSAQRHGCFTQVSPIAGRPKRRPLCIDS